MPTKAPNPHDRLKSLQGDLVAIQKKAKDEGRDFTDDEISEIETKSAEAIELKGKIERSAEADAIFDRIAGDVDSEPAMDSGRTVAGGRRKGFLALSGAGAKRAAKSLAAKASSESGVKGLAAMTPMPLSPSSPIELGKVPASVLEILPSTEHDSPKYRYPRQTLRTNNAAVVPTGAEKPVSKVTTEMVDGELRVVATMSEPHDEYMLQDADVLARFLDAELRYMLLAAVEDEVINGDGTTGHLAGLLSVEGVQSQEFVTDPVTTLRMAALKAENVGHQADVFVVNPQDWATIETTRNTSGAFDLGTAVDRAAQKLWSTQVVTSSQIAVGSAVSLDLSVVGLDVDSRGIQTKWFNVNDGKTNEVQARVEGRFGVSVYQPLGIVKATLSEPTGE